MSISSHEEEERKINEAAARLKLSKMQVVSDDNETLKLQFKAKPKQCRQCVHFAVRNDWVEVCLHEESVRYNPIGDTHYRTAREMRKSKGLCGPEAFFFKQSQSALERMPTWVKVLFVLGALSLIGIFAFGGNVYG